MAEVRLENVTKRYGSKEAVSDMTWTASQGEFVVLFGPSGAGKTTTLKLIAGLEACDEGSLLFDGQSMHEVETADRDVAMAFENYALYPHISVFENIAFPMMIPGRGRGITKDEIRRRVMEVARILQIDMLLDRKPQQLSGGQRQRVALGRCLVREPRVCLLDEPIAHLDAKLRHRMYAELKRIQRERGTTTLYATPAQTEAMAMADRIIIVFEGKVQQIATPRELYECPATVSVARFGGEQPMNIMPATLEQDGGQMYFVVADHRFRAPEMAVRAVENNGLSRDILLGVRPPDIDLCLEKPVEDLLPGTLYAVEQLGRTARVTVQVGENLIEVATKPDLCDFSESVGEAIWLSMQGGSLYIFDAQTEKLVIYTGTANG
jgi:multiple sugar transport system ATP-binding protein